MPKADMIIYNIGELVTFNKGPQPARALRDPANAGIIKNAAVAVRGKRIVDVGDSGRISSTYDSDICVNAGGRLVTPGLVDSHTHLVFAGSREDEFELKLQGYSYDEILARGEGIYRTVRATMEASVGELRRMVLERLILMARHGTTVVEVKTGYGLLPEYEVKMLNVLEGLDSPGIPRIIPTLLAHVVPEEYLDKRLGYIDLFVNHVIPSAMEARVKPKYIDVFCDKGAFNVEETRRIIQAGLEVGLRARLHAEELAYIGCSGLLKEVHLDSVDHLEYLPVGNIDYIVARRTVATLLPTSMLSIFPEQKPPVDALREKGALIAIATDYNPNNMNPVLATTMDLSTYLLRLTPLEALAASTINAAWSLRVDDMHGRIAPGTSADIIVWDAPSYRWIGYEWGRDKTLVVAVRGALVKNELGGTC